MKLWSWLKDRACGIFLHISSLPSQQGIGCFNRSAYEFIEFLKDAGMKYWQICPLNPTSYGDSPYQSPSVFAGTPYFIDLQKLEEEGLLSIGDLETLMNLPHSYIDFGQLYNAFWPIIRIAFDNFSKQESTSQEFKDFCENSSWWLNDYASFMAIKDKFDGREWTKWPKEFSNYKNAQLEIANDDELKRSENFYKFIQWKFLEHWEALKVFAKKHEILIVGDIPIFTGFDSADVWANRQIFKLNDCGSPKFVAGVPPDAFSSTGQLWGNPVYDWKVLEENNFAWWVDRIKRCAEMYDVIRLDHFRGFCDYWEISAPATTGLKGKWKKSSGIKFFKHIKKIFPDIKFIAEDLGDLNKDVVRLLEDTGLPGMSILHFAFDGNSKNKYLPHEHEKNSALYIGTHDNDTTRGWFKDTPEKIKEQIRCYLRTNGEDIAWDMIKKAYESPANFLILTMQDILNLGSDARFNRPNTTTNNWQWRIISEQIKNLDKLGTTQYLKHLQTVYGR